jgi:hypothetical protein
MCVTYHDFSTFCSKRRARLKKLLLPNENTYLLELVCTVSRHLKDDDEDLGISQ